VGGAQGDGRDAEGVEAVSDGYERLRGWLIGRGFDIEESEVRAAVGRMQEPMRTVVAMRFGLDGRGWGADRSGCYTLKEVGARIGKSATRVAHLEGQAFRFIVQDRAGLEGLSTRTYNIIRREFGCETPDEFEEDLRENGWEHIYNIGKKTSDEIQLWLERRQSQEKER
jgi:hypothetical protein